MRNLFFIILLFCSMDAYSVQPLGRLFFTPTERQTLEQQRHNKSAAVVQSGGNVTVNGVIQKHGTGKTVVWINNSPQNELHSVPDKNNHKSSVPMTIPSTGQSVDVKVGQTLDMDSGSVAETYEARRKNRQKNKSNTTPVEQDSKPANGH